MGLLDFQHITKYYGQRLLLNDVSFSVERGERLSLIGPNGSGKTTLLRIAMGDETCDSGSVVRARGVQAGYLMQNLDDVTGDDNALTFSEYAQLEEKIRGLERQMASLRGDPLTEAMARYEKLTARYEAMDGYTIESRLKAVLLGLGLRKEALATPLQLLSSGEKMRVALARILIKSPDLLVLDEPTNHLDIQALKWLEDYLSHFSGGVLIVSHDRYFLDRVTTRLVELSGTTVVTHHGNYSSFLNQQSIRHDFFLRERARLDREIKQEQALARRLRQTAHITQAQSREKGIERLTAERQRLLNSRREGHLGAISGPALKLRAPEHASAEIVVAEHATKRIGQRVLFEDASFLIRGGERVGLIGPNGCGKTTLLRILLGLDQDYTGVLKVGPWVKIGLLDQNAEFENERRTMIEEVIAKKEMTPNEAKRALAKVGFYGDETLKTIDKLSGGERVRLKLALLLLDTPQCLILDEPTNHLDLPAREAVEQAITGFTGSVLSVSHDRYFLNQCANRILAFEGTRIVPYEGNWDAYEAQRAAIEEAAAPRDAKGVDRRPTQAAQSIREAEIARERLEAEIQILEESKVALEEQMVPGADQRIYEEYAQIDGALAALYGQWTALDA